MKKMKRFFAIVTIAVMMFSLTACSSCGAQPEEQPPVATVTPSVQEVEPKVEVTAPVEVVTEPTPEVVEPTEDPKDKPEVVEPTTEPTPEVEPTEEPQVTEPVKEEVTEASLEAKVNGKHYVGDTLSASDFTVTVTMSDGSTVKNPAGWNADKLTLDAETTVITITYKNLSTQVTVKAEVKQQAQQPAQEPQQPQQQKYPASAYQPICQQAVDDLYNYAIARGYVLKSSVAKNGFAYNYVELDDIPGVPSNYIEIIYVNNQWSLIYAKHSDPDFITQNYYTGTIEFLYKYFFE